MKDTTKNFLNDLKKIGIDVSGLEAQLNANTPAATAADNLFHGGITRLPEFTKIVNEKRQLEAQIAAGHDKLNSGNMTPDERAKFINHITAMEKLLIDDFGADPAEVEALSVELKQTSTTEKTVTPNSNIVTNSEVNPMDEKKVQEMIQGGMAQMGMGSTMLNLNILSTMSQFQQLYNRPPNQQELASFQTVFAREIQSGNPNAINVAQEEAFKFTEKTTEVNTANFNAQIEAAKQLGRTEALKEHGIVGAPKTPNGMVPLSPVFARRVGANAVVNNNGQQNVQAQNTQTPPPATQIINQQPNGVQLTQAGVDVRHAHLADNNGLFPFQRRGNQQTRVASALNFAETNGINLYDEYGMGNVLNPNPQQ